MKKIYVVLSILFLFNSCGPNCEPYELNRYVITDSNKEYFIPEQRTDTYINNEGDYIEIKFEKGEISLGSVSDDHDCGYTSYEIVKQNFSLGNYVGNIYIGNGAIEIYFSDYVVNNQLATSSNQSKELDELTSDIDLAGFSFKNVLQLSQINNSQFAVWDVETIIYSKQNGIELILFRNNTWLKKVIN